jgi:quercetin dioxygenase-like cupin family protein
MRRALCASVWLIAASTIGAHAALAQEVKRTELKHEDVPGTNLEVIVQLVETPPGAVSPKHYHNGQEISYVLEGGQVQFPGKEPQTRTPGEVSYNKREVPHAGYKVVGDKTLKSLNIYIVDKGKPLAVPVQ